MFLEGARSSHFSQVAFGAFLFFGEFREPILDAMQDTAKNHKDEDIRKAAEAAIKLIKERPKEKPKDKPKEPPKK